MNVLLVGLPFSRARNELGEPAHSAGHEFRFLGAEGDVDFLFAPNERATDVINRISRTWRPDLILCWFPELHPPPLYVEDSPVKTAAVISDWNVYVAPIQLNACRYDVVISDKLGAQHLSLPGARPQYVMPIYAQDALRHRPHDVPKDIDVLFAGNLNHAVHVERGKMLEKIAALSGRRRVVICSGYHDDAYAQLLSRARIVFNHSIRQELNLRCFETLACGSLLFLDESNIEVRDLFQDRVHLVLYRPDNLVDLLEHYLDHEDEATAIARRGLALSPELTPANRLPVLCDWIEKQPLGPRAFRGKAEADKAFASILQYASSLVEGQRDAAQEMLENAIRAYPKKPDFLVAAGCLALERAVGSPPAEQRSFLHEAATRFQAALEHSPDSIPLHLNMAFFFRQVHQGDAEMRWLRAALAVTGISHGGLLLGSLNDPCYHAWRRSMALGAVSPDVLRAGAAARLAALLAERGNHGEALAWAQRSIAWHAGSAAACAVAAKAERHFGRDGRAVDVALEGLSRTAFDAPYRRMLIDLLCAAGRTADARAIAEQSAALFSACPHEAETTATFRDLASSLSVLPGPAL